MTTILGLSVFHADASAAAVVDGHFVAGVEEERFRRIKHWAGFPEQALRWCAGEVSGAARREVDRRRRRPAAPRLPAPQGGARPDPPAQPPPRRLAGPQPDPGRRTGGRVGRHGAADRAAPRFVAVEHHLAHVASAFYCSPFDEAMCLTVDGFGDFVSTMMAVGRGDRLEVLQRVHFPHSLGLLYGAVTQHLGFLGFGDEYKVMGLAAFGEPRFEREIAQLVPAFADGTFRLDLRYFRHLSEGVDMTWEDGAPEPAGCSTRPCSRGCSDPPDAPTRSCPAPPRPRRFAAVGLRGALLRAGARVGCRTGLRRLCSRAAARSTRSPTASCSTDRRRRRGLHPGGGRRRRHLARRRALRPSRCARGAAKRLRHGALYVGTRVRRGLKCARRSRPVSAASAGRTAATARIDRRDASPTRAAWRPTTAAAIAAGEVVGWYQGRSEWGPARARQPLDRRRPAAPRHEGPAQSQDQAPRVVPAVRPLGSRRAHRRMVHPRPPRSLHAQGLPDPPREAGAHPGRDPRRRDRPPADGLAAAPTPLLGPHRGVRAPQPACRWCSTPRSTKTSRSSTRPPRP